MPDYDSDNSNGLTAKKWAWIVIGGLALAGVFWGLSRSGLKRVDAATVPDAMNADQWKLAGEIDGIMERYRKHDAEEESRGNLLMEVTRAISLQEEILRINPNLGVEQTERLEELLRARDTLVAQQSWQRIRGLETQLKSAEEGRERVAILSELLSERREVNRSRASARYKDLARETQLERELTAAQAKPLKEEVEAVWQNGRAALRNEDWLTALECYSRARELMDEINDRFARTRFADVGFASQLRETEVSLQGANESVEITVLTEGAEERLAGADHVGAADFYAKAAALQDGLNRSWPQSRFASGVKRETLETKAQTTMAQGMLIEARRLDEAVVEQLAHRRVRGASQIIEKLDELLKTIGRDYPRSEVSDEELSRKYDYLMTLRGELRELQDGVYRQLVPLQGRERVMILPTLVDQATYVSLMRFNPSQNRDEQWAVNSLEWTVAREFCRRLGWVMGREVRMPREEEVNLTKDLGNTRDGISEWLQADETGEQAPVASSQTDGHGAVSEVVWLDKTTRAEGLGFRIVVEPIADR